MSTFQHLTKPFPIRSTILVYFPDIYSNLLAERTFCFWGAACAVETMDLIPRVYIATFFIMLPKLLKYSTFSGCFWSIIFCIGDGYLEISINLDHHHHQHHHHHKHQWLDPLIRSVSTVTAARTNASSVFQLFSFLAVCSGMISNGFGFVAFFASVKASSVCIHLSCLVCL